LYPGRSFLSVPLLSGQTVQLPSSLSLSAAILGFQSPCYRVRQCNRPREVDKTLGITGFSSNQVSTATPFFSQIPFLRQNTLHLRKWDFIHHSPSLAKNPLFILTKALHNILANTRDIFSKWMAEQNLTPALTYLISVCCLSSSPLQAPAKRNRG